MLDFVGIELVSYTHDNNIASPAGLVLWVEVEVDPGSDVQTVKLELPNGTDDDLDFDPSDGGWYLEWNNPPAPHTGTYTLTVTATSATETASIPFTISPPSGFAVITNPAPWAVGVELPQLITWTLPVPLPAHDFVTAELGNFELDFEELASGDLPPGSTEWLPDPPWELVEPNANHALFVQLGRSAANAAAMTQQGTAFAYELDASSFNLVSFTTGSWVDAGGALPGAAGPPQLVGEGSLLAGSSGSLALTNAKASANTMLFLGSDYAPTPFKGGLLTPVPAMLGLLFSTDPSGKLDLPFLWPAGVPSEFDFYVQMAVLDPHAPLGVALSNTLHARTP